MACTTVFIESPLQGTYIHLTKEKHRHLTQVLRIKKGHKLRLIVPKQCAYFCYVSQISHDGLHLTDLSAFKLSPPTTKITLFQALPKGDKMSDLIRMCIQLGIDGIQPFISQYCEAKEIKPSKFERLKHCILSAAEQSHQDYLAQLFEPKCFQECLDHIQNQAFDSKILCYEFAKPTQHLLKQLPKTPKHIALMIGPEGGFSDSEIEAAKKAGLSIAFLSDHTLRTEHAGFCAISMIKGYLESL